MRFSRYTVRVGHRIVGANTSWISLGRAYSLCMQQNFVNVTRFVRRTLAA